MCDSTDTKIIKIEIIEDHNIISCEHPIWHNSYPYCSLALLPIKLEYEEENDNKG